MLCILTSFWVLHALKRWLKLFFQPFSTFFVHFKPFSVISGLKWLKSIWKWTIKNVFCLLLKADRHAKAGQLPEGVPRNCLFSVDFLQKRLKTAEKKCFNQLLGARSTQMLVEIHNIDVLLFVLCETRLDQNSPTKFTPKPSPWYPYGNHSASSSAIPPEQDSSVGSKGRLFDSDSYVNTKWHWYCYSRLFL